MTDNDAQPTMGTLYVSQEELEELQTLVASTPAQEDATGFKILLVVDDAGKAAQMASVQERWNAEALHG